MFLRLEGDKLNRRLSLFIGVCLVVVVVAVSLVILYEDEFLTDLTEPESKPDTNNDQDPNRPEFDDYVSTLNGTLQEKLYDAFLKDGKISTDELNQIKFLKTFTQAEQARMIQSGEFADFDPDKDNMKSYFEKCIAGLPWNVYNGRYAILVDTWNISRTVDSMRSFLVNEQGYLPENIIVLFDQNATKSNWEHAVSKVSAVADRNSLVYVMFNTHGNINGLVLKESDNGIVTMKYEDIGTDLDTIRSNATAVSIFACRSELALDHLKIKNSPYIVVTMPPDFIFATSKNYDNLYSNTEQYAPLEFGDYDPDGNGYVSIGESFNAQMKSMEEYLVNHPEQALKEGISNPDDIEFYFGDFSIKDQNN
jgi:hypothetical protein